MVLRILKFMDFQPRMGAITRTLAEACVSLVHFFIVFLMIFLGYGLFGNIAFGGRISQFRSLPISFDTMINAINGDDTIDASFLQLSGWSLVAAILYWWSFTLLLSYVTFNLLIAIFVDSYIQVKDGFKHSPSMGTELYFICQTNIRKRILGAHYPSDLMVERELKRLGGMKQANKEEEERNEAQNIMTSSREHGKDLCPAGKPLPAAIAVYNQPCEVAVIEKAIKEAAKLKALEGVEIGGAGEGMHEYTDRLTHAIVAHCSAVKLEDMGESMKVHLHLGEAQNNLGTVVEKLEEQTIHDTATQEWMRINQERLEGRVDEIAHMLAKILERPKAFGQ
eukprot:TRINITY_DN10482_c0_g2_i1.p1 TRINITY_DN10482_c0_g2~~TRINITY_DN10482_c0_g2_i1.p1  ORF type:complete len:337 (-),score=61.17 TRINITY_DN10482_c0_g2_i1:629-1639(-)